MYMAPEVYNGFEYNQKVQGWEVWWQYSGSTCHLYLCFTLCIRGSILYPTAYEPVSYTPHCTMHNYPNPAFLTSQTLTLAFFSDAPNPTLRTSQPSNLHLERHAPQTLYNMCRSPPTSAFQRPQTLTPNPVRWMFSPLRSSCMRC